MDISKKSVNDVVLTNLGKKVIANIDRTLYAVDVLIHGRFDVLYQSIFRKLYVNFAFIPLPAVQLPPMPLTLHLLSPTTGFSKDNTAVLSLPEIGVYIISLQK